MDEDNGPSMMTVTSRVIIVVCWLVLISLGLLHDQWKHWPPYSTPIATVALTIIGLVLLAEWWRWEQKIK